MTVQGPSRSEMFFKGFDGSQIFLQAWLNPDSCGTVLLTHGQAEHSDCYHRTIVEFQEIAKQNNHKPWDFIAWDLRGHGRSDGIRGYARDVDDYVLDYECFLQKVFENPKVLQKPIILLAHSLGGLIQTCALTENKVPKATAQVLSAPFLGVSVKVPTWKDVGSEFVNRLVPKLTLGNELKTEFLTRDPEMIREFELDPYRHNKISAGVYLSSKREFKNLIGKFSNIELPTFMLISDNDPVVSSTAAMHFFDSISSPKKGLKIVEGGAHELFNDVGRKDSIKAVYDFCQQFIS